MTSSSDSPTKALDAEQASDPIQDRAAVETPGEDQVIAYLRRHPDLLDRHRDLLEVLAAPSRQYGDGIVDMQRFQIEHLMAELETVRRHHRKLVTAAKHNAVVDGQVRKATLCLLDAGSLPGLIDTLRGEAARALEVEDVVLLVARDGDASMPDGVTAADAAALDALAATDGGPVLRGRVSPEQAQAIYGEDSAPLIKSDALVRLKPRDDAPAMLLALGAIREATFHPGQGSDLLQFLARIVEKCLALWWPTAK